MTVEQIYALVNEVNSEAFGSNALAVVDTSSLISLGNTVLSSSTNTEVFLNTLAQRIGRTILRFRDYRNKLGDMVLNDFEFDDNARIYVITGPNRGGKSVITPKK